MAGICVKTCDSILFAGDFHSPSGAVHQRFAGFYLMIRFCPAMKTAVTEYRYRHNYGNDYDSFSHFALFTPCSYKMPFGAVTYFDNTAFDLIHLFQAVRGQQ